MRVILDTNIWISYLISKDLNWIDEFVKSNEFELIFSDQLIEEFLMVASRPKIKKYFDEEKVKKVIDCFTEFGLLVEVKSKIEKCRDPNDDFLLGLAVDGEANFLITGDKDLLSLQNAGSCVILSLKDWQEKVK